MHCRTSVVRPVHVRRHGIQFSMLHESNVNWKTFGLLQAEAGAQTVHSLFNLGPCARHIVRNPFCYGLVVTDCNVESVLNVLHWLG